MINTIERHAEEIYCVATQYFLKKDDARGRLMLQLILDLYPDSGAAKDAKGLIAILEESTRTIPR